MGCGVSSVKALFRMTGRTLGGQIFVHKFAICVQTRQACGPDRATNNKPGVMPGLLFSSRRFACYFRSSSCPVNEPRIRRILPRPTAPWLEAAKEPSTCLNIASVLAVAPSKAAQFLNVVTR